MKRILQNIGYNNDNWKEILNNNGYEYMNRLGHSGDVYLNRNVNDSILVSESGTDISFTDSQRSIPNYFEEFKSYKDNKLRINCFRQRYNKPIGEYIEYDNNKVVKHLYYNNDSEVIWDFTKETMTDKDIFYLALTDNKLFL